MRMGVRARVRTRARIGVGIRMRVGIRPRVRVRVRLDRLGAHHLAQHEDREDQPVAHLHAGARGAPLERRGPPGWGKGWGWGWGWRWGWS